MKSRKVAVVTNAGSGVGAATSAMLASRGWDIVVNYSRNKVEAEGTAAACRDNGAGVMMVPADVAQDADCRALVKAVGERWGRIDALVNHTWLPVFEDALEWDTVAMQDFQNVYAVNTVGTFQMVRACLAHLKAAHGAVVNVSSVAGALGVGPSVPFVASSGALNSMTLHMARALAPEVRVNAVCPGPMASRLPDAGVSPSPLARNHNATTPLRTTSTPENVADAIVWLLDHARTVTGELMLLDSGMHL